MRTAKKGCKAVILVDFVISWRQTEGRELSSRASCILGCYRLCWSGWSHKGSCAIQPLSCAPPAGLSPLPGRQSLGLLTHSIDYPVRLNLGSLQTSSYNCRNKYFGRTTAPPLCRSGAVIPWHVDGRHHLCSTNDTRYPVLVEQLHWKEIKTATWILARVYLLVQALQFLYSHVSLNRRSCFLQVFFHLNIFPLVQTFRCWWHWSNTSWGKYSVTRSPRDLPALQTCTRFFS